MRKHTLLFMIVIGSSLVISGLSQPTTAQTRGQDPVHGLKSPSTATRQAAAEKIKKDRRDLIAQLLVMAQQDAGGKEIAGMKELSIDLLGEVGAQEAIQFLIRNIEFSPPGIVGELSRLGRFPSARALVKIGKRSPNEILAFVNPSVSDKALALYAEVIRQIDGDQIGRFRIQKALEGNIRGSKKATLEKFLRVYDKNEAIR